MPDEEQPESSADQDAPTAEEQPTPSTEQDVPTAEEQSESSTDEADTTAEPPTRRMFSLYGIGSAVLGLLSIAAIVLGVIVWSGHRDHTDERAYENRVMGTAGTWATVLINLNPGNLDAGMQRLREKTTGQLNAEFDSVIAPYRERAQKLAGRNTGRLESLAIEEVHQEGDAAAGTQSTAPRKSTVGSRTDTVTAVAISIVEIPNEKPRGLRLIVQLDVSNVDGKLLISQLRPIR